MEMRRVNGDRLTHRLVGTAMTRPEVHPLSLTARDGVQEGEEAQCDREAARCWFSVVMSVFLGPAGVRIASIGDSAERKQEPRVRTESTKRLSHHKRQVWNPALETSRRDGRWSISRSGQLETSATAVLRRRGSAPIAGNSLARKPQASRRPRSARPPAEMLDTALLLRRLVMHP